MLVAGLCGSQGRRFETIVFVCENGSAKSAIAGAHFNRIVESRGLPHHAISCGVNPDGAVPKRIYAIGGDGAISIIQQQDADQYSETPKS